MKFRERIMQFMAGRYGTDQLNQFLLIACVVLLVIGIFFSGTVKAILDLLLTAGLVIITYRMLSKDFYKRQSENTRFLQVRYRLFGKLKTVKEQWVQRKDYKFFTCPSCKAVLRVPKGKGKIKIMCRKCGNSFIGKS